MLGRGNIAPHSGRNGRKRGNAKRRPRLPRRTRLRFLTIRATFGVRLPRRYASKQASRETDSSSAICRLPPPQQQATAVASSSSRSSREEVAAPAVLGCLCKLDRRTLPAYWEFWGAGKQRQTVVVRSTEDDPAAVKHSGYSYSRKGLPKWRRKENLDNLCLGRPPPPPHTHTPLVGTTSVNPTLN